jgi:phosphoenolpyruvate carboxylase
MANVKTLVLINENLELTTTSLRRIVKSSFSQLSRNILTERKTKAFIIKEVIRKIWPETIEKFYVLLKKKNISKNEIIKTKYRDIMLNFKKYINDHNLNHDTFKDSSHGSFIFELINIIILYIHFL